MTKNELTRALSAKAGITQVKAARVIEAFLSALTLALARGESLTLPGFGTFKLSPHKERIGRNPSTGQEITIPARKVPRFVPGKELADLVQGNE